jgi:Ion channel
MLTQLAIGGAIIALNVAIHALFIAGAISWQRRFFAWLAHLPRFAMNLAGLSLTTLWMMAALSAQVWVWSLLFLRLGLFDGTEPALYFTLQAFATLGFGDLPLPQEWRLLSGMVAANGFLVFGFSTAFLFEIISRLRHQQAAGS